jgi:branched-chain amino acid transport system substrate-binding protein
LTGCTNFIKIFKVRLSYIYESRRQGMKTFLRHIKPVVLLGALATSLPSMAADRTIMVLQALTGGAAFVGVPAVEGMKLAAAELNAKNFFGGDKLNVVVVDSATDRGQAMAAVTRAANDPSVLAVLGPTTAPEALPSASIANDLKITMMPMTNASAVLKVGPWSFISAQTAETTMPLLGDYVVNTLKVKSCAAIYFSDNDAYVELGRLFRAHTEPKGLKFVEYIGVRSADTDFSAVSTRVVAAKPECVLFFTLGPVAANLAIQLKQAGLPASVKLVGQTGVASPQLVTIGGAAVEGLVFNSDWTPGGSTPVGKAFAEAYKKATGKDADNWAALGYSYMTVLATAVKNAGPNPTREKVRDALTNSKNVPVPVGAGQYSFEPGSRLPKYGNAFLTIKNGQFVAAPQ